MMESISAKTAPIKIYSISVFFTDESNLIKNEV